MQRRLAIWLITLGICFTLGGVLFSIYLSLLGAQSYGNLKCLATACFLYAGEHGDRFPPLESTEVARKALAPYIHGSDDELWTVPGQPCVFFQPNPALSNKHINAIKDTEDAFLFYEPSERLNQGRGRMVAKAFPPLGRFVSSAAWPEVAQKNGIPFGRSNKAADSWGRLLAQGMVVFGLEMLVCATVLGVVALHTRKRN